jgi:hypothetical protein
MAGEGRAPASVYAAVRWRVYFHTPNGRKQDDWRMSLTKSALHASPEVPKA